MISLTSEELNYLVFRYLHESGFTHAAFAFGFEAGINKSKIDGNIVPPGALITFVQKGIQYLELEANLTSDDLDVDEDFSFLQPLDLITKDVSELQKMIKDKKKITMKNKMDPSETRKELNQEFRQEPVQGRELGKKSSRKEQEDGDRLEKERAQKRIRTDEKPNQDNAEAKVSEDKIVAESEATSGGPEKTSFSSTQTNCEFASNDVVILEGHASEVFACAWSPVGSVLASGSGDSTARIWSIAERHSNSNVQNAPVNAVVLKHFNSKSNEKSKDVTTLDWNGEGTLLATGSYDGQARIWSRDGELKSTLTKHRGPIFSLKWNKKGDYLLTGSVDKTAIVWDVRTGTWKQQFEFHTAPTLDVDWRNNVSFATCSTDNIIHVCKVGEIQPIKTFSGHEGEVNAIKWDPSGSLLASCSDDCTAKIWNIKQDNYVHNLKEHTKEIYTIRWSPTGPGTNNPNQQLVLASASFDSTVKLWDVERGTALSSLSGHRDSVYSVAFSPNGQYLASGSLDRCVHIWSVKEAKIVKTYTGKGGIFEVCWNREGDKVAACFANNIVCVMDFRM